jgi:6-phosphogluconolactonase
MSMIETIDAASDNSIAEWLAERLSEALAETSAEIALTVPGGSTPFPIMAALAATPLDWSRLVFWPNDDRIVPQSHPASNTDKIRGLFEPLGARIMALNEHAVPPRFALTWLGMGTDGHIASLFPNTDPQCDDAMLVRRLTPDPLPPEAPFERITLTIPALLRSAALVFVIRGEAKRSVFAAAAASENDLPIARLLRAATQPVTCFI